MERDARVEAVADSWGQFWVWAPDARREILEALKGADSDND